MRDTEREVRQRQREKQDPCGELDAELDPRTLGSQPELKAGAQPLSHPSAPLLPFLKMVLISAWVAQSVNCLPLAQVMILGSSLASVSLLNGEPASPPVSLPCLCFLSLCQKDKILKKRQFNKLQCAHMVECYAAVQNNPR